MSIEERELKLTPESSSTLDDLWSLNALGPFAVVGRSTELQRNSFFDTRDRALRDTRIGFRRRVVEGQSLATWTLKAEGELVKGVATRPEIELQLGADMPPALALDALRQAAAQRGAAVLAEQVGDAVSSGSLPLATPVVETETERRILELRADDHGWQAELALDSVRLIGHPDFAEIEIEVELKRGNEAALEAARSAIEAIASVRESVGSKLSRALDHVEVCGCSAA
jgi:inorganic triphosphatase YgiF